MYRIFGHDNQPPIDVHTYKALLAAIRSSKPGYYAIYEVKDGVQVPKDKGQELGVGVKFVSGSIRIEMTPGRG
jgi:hypothetical protein